MPHEFACRVYYEDTDLAGIVYYANYLKFIERARSEALDELGVDQRHLRDGAGPGTGMVFAVRRVEADYLASAHLLDRLRVLTSVTRLGGASVDLDQQVWRGETCLFRARVVVVAIDAAGRPVRLPDEARQALGRIGAPMPQDLADLPRPSTLTRI